MNDPYVDLGDRPFARWAGPEHTIAIPPRALRWLTSHLGELTPAPPPVDPADLEVPPSGLPDEARDRFRGIVGSRYFDESRDARLAHTGGQSYVDLMRRRAGLDLTYPDAVVRPADHDQVCRLLAACAEHGVAVVPYGGGTSVVGGVTPHRKDHIAVVTLDLSRLARLRAYDPVSEVATFGAGVTGPQAEQLLAQHDRTLGHFPQSFARGSLGGFVATRSAGQASTGYGRIDDLVVGLRVAAPTGDLALGTGTPNAAGPDLRALFVGSEGALGVLTEVSLRVRPVPVERQYEMWMLPSFGEGLRVLRELEHAGLAADVVRLSDEDETAVTRAMAGMKGRTAGVVARMRGIRTPVFCVLGWEGTAAGVRARRRDTTRALREAGAASLGESAGRSWHRQRYAGPVQRDSLLDAGVLVETLETATSWARLPELYAATRAALVTNLTDQGTPPLVMTHVSHLYPTGASLYFTVLARARPEPAQAIAQWEPAKAAATEALLRAAGTISHHHAVGRLHADQLSSEIDPLGMDVLRHAKAALDPRGILNPGVLLP